MAVVMSHTSMKYKFKTVFKFAMMKLDKKLKIKSAKISFLRIYIYREGDLRDEDLFVHRLLSPLFAVFVCNHFPNGSCDMSQVAFIMR